MKAEVTVATTTSNSETFVSEETQALPSNLIAHHFNHFIGWFNVKKIGIVQTWAGECGLA